MTATLLVIHMIVTLAMIVLVLLQRSEGGALGIGGSGGAGGGMFSSRGVGNALNKMTTILAFVFFLTSIGLTVLGSMGSRDSIIDELVPEQESEGLQAPAPLLPDVLPDMLPDMAPPKSE